MYEMLFVGSSGGVVGTYPDESNGPLGLVVFGAIIFFIIVMVVSTAFILHVRKRNSNNPR